MALRTSVVRLELRLAAARRQLASLAEPCSAQGADYLHTPRFWTGLAPEQCPGYDVCARAAVTSFHRARARRSFAEPVQPRQLHSHITTRARARHREAPWHRDSQTTRPRRRDVLRASDAGVAQMPLVAARAGPAKTRRAAPTVPRGVLREQLDVDGSPVLVAANRGRVLPPAGARPPTREGLLLRPPRGARGQQAARGGRADGGPRRRVRRLVRDGRRRDDVGRPRDARGGTVTAPSGCAACQRACS